VVNALVSMNEVALRRARRAPADR